MCARTRSRLRVNNGRFGERGRRPKRRVSSGDLNRPPPRLRKILLIIIIIVLYDNNNNNNDNVTFRYNISFDERNLARVADRSVTDGGERTFFKWFFAVSAER